MITSKQDLNEYLMADKIALGVTRKHPGLFEDSIWTFEILYRKTEYWQNKKKSRGGVFNRLIAHMYMWRYKRQCLKHLCEIPINCIDKGLIIWHLGNIVINPGAKIGKNFSISGSTNIGQAHDLVPVIGDNVTLCFGASILGGVHIADNVTIGSRALVLKDVNEEYVTLGGVPAKILKHHNHNEPMLRG